MYLQLLHQSQPTGPSYRRGVINSGAAGEAGRRKESGRGGGGGGNGSNSNSNSNRAAGRFGFINAVMAHARDGGNPLDIEEACGSDAGGFTQDGYAGTPSPRSTPVQRQQEGEGEEEDEEVGAVAAATAGCLDWSPCDAMSSGGSTQSSNG